MKRLVVVLSTISLSLAITACHRDDGDEREENAAIEANAANAANAMIAKPTPPTNNTAIAPKPKASSAPPPEVSDVEQMHDDADATGMTARLPSPDSGVPAAVPQGAPSTP